MTAKAILMALCSAGLLPMWSHQLPAGIEAVFMLTAEQKGALRDARSEVYGSEAARAAAKTSADEDATEEQKAEATKVLLAARDKMREKAMAILTPEQKALSAKLNAAFAEVREPLWAEFIQKLRDEMAAIARGASGANLFKEFNEKLKAAYAKKLDGILTEEQKSAMAKAAAEAEAAKKRALGARRREKAKRVD